MPEFNRDDYPVRPSVQVPKGPTDRVRSADAETWTAANPVLDKGESGYAVDTKTLKIGDGESAWNDLEPLSAGTSDGPTLQDVDDAVAGGIAGHLPGRELAYAERATDFTTTNTNATSVAETATIGMLSTTVYGTGEPVEVEFFSGLVKHSVVNTTVMIYFIVNGIAAGPDGQYAAVQSINSTQGRTLIMKRRLVLTDGVAYTFQVGVVGGAAGTSTIGGTAAAPTYLSVTAR
jgi:hypothetical protein